MPSETDAMVWTCASFWAIKRHTQKMSHDQSHKPIQKCLHTPTQLSFIVRSAFPVQTPRHTHTHTHTHDRNTSLPHNMTSDFMKWYNKVFRDSWLVSSIRRRSTFSKQRCWYDGRAAAAPNRLLRYLLVSHIQPGWNPQLSQWHRRQSHKNNKQTKGMFYHHHGSKGKRWVLAGAMARYIITLS